MIVTFNMPPPATLPSFLFASDRFTPAGQYAIASQVFTALASIDEIGVPQSVLPTVGNWNS